MAGVSLPWIYPTHTSPAARASLLSLGLEIVGFAFGRCFQAKGTAQVLGSQSLPSSWAKVPAQEQPALFSLEERRGAGMLHVDDVMSTGSTPCLQSLEKPVGSKYKLHSEWFLDIGDEACFLKRKHMLVQPDLLLIVPSVKHVDKLLELTGLSKAKLRVRKTPLPVGGLPIDKESGPLWMQLRAPGTAVP